MLIHIKYIQYSWKIWQEIKFSGLVVCLCNCQIKICQYFLLTYIHMAIPYQTAKFRSANILVMEILGPTANLIPANISVSMVFLISVYFLPVVK